MLARSARSLRKTLTGVRAFASGVPDVMVRARARNDPRERERDDDARGILRAVSRRRESDDDARDARRGRGVVRRRRVRRGRD